jgi:hypothetical protein
MIKELRIGNYVKIHGKPTQMELSDFNFDPLFIKPIPLTEEWLLKFGFDKNENGLFKLFNESEVPILLNEDLNGWTCDGINFSINGTQYVHQLQNLYFALTGEELTIKN